MSLIKRATQYKQAFFNTLASSLGSRALAGGLLGAGAGALGGHAVGDPGHILRRGNQGETTLLGAIGGGALGAGLGALGMRPGSASRLTDKARMLRSARGLPSAAATQTLSKPKVVMPTGHSPTINVQPNSLVPYNTPVTTPVAKPKVVMPTGHSPTLRFTPQEALSNRLMQNLY